MISFFYRENSETRNYSFLSIVSNISLHSGEQRIQMLMFCVFLSAVLNFFVFLHIKISVDASFHYFHFCNNFVSMAYSYVHEFLFNFFLFLYTYIFSQKFYRERGWS